MNDDLNDNILIDKKKELWKKIYNKSKLKTVL